MRISEDDLAVDFFGSRAFAKILVDKHKLTEEKKMGTINVIKPTSEGGLLEIRKLTLDYAVGYVNSNQYGWQLVSEIAGAFEKYLLEGYNPSKQAGLEFPRSEFVKD